MREFYVLSHDDSREDIEAVVDYDISDFDATIFWRCDPFNGSIPPAVRLWVSEGEPSDYLGNPLSWQIVSYRLWALIHPLVQRHCQLIQLPLYYETTKVAVPGYMLMNVTCCLSASKSPEIEIGNLALDENCIPSDVHMFRLREASTVLIASDLFLKAVFGKKLRGMAFIRTH